MQQESKKPTRVLLTIPEEYEALFQRVRSCEVRPTAQNTADRLMKLGLDTWANQHPLLESQQAE